MTMISVIETTTELLGCWYGNHEVASFFAPFAAQMVCEGESVVLTLTRGMIENMFASVGDFLSGLDLGVGRWTEPLGDDDVVLRYRESLVL